MNLDELRSVQSAERQSDALQHLRDGFYQDAGEYVEELRSQRRGAAEEAADPYGDEDVRRLTDEIETAKAVTEAIWEARIGKILRVAGLSATDVAANAEGLTPEEAALFERVVDAIETNRETIQGALEGQTEVPSRSEPPAGSSDGDGRDGPAPSDSTPAPPDVPGSDPTAPPETPQRAGAETPSSEVSSATTVAGSESEESVKRETAPADGVGSATEASDGAGPDTDDSAPTVGASSESTNHGDGGDGSTANTPAGPDEDATPADAERVRVLITEDVGTIAGVDGREYHLAVDDVVELPEANAQPLLERDAAAILD